MRLVTLFLIAAFAASTVDAASYLKTDGTIVDPIVDLFTLNTHNEKPHLYNGANLEPEADLTGAYLFYADLTGADLYNANLYDADLRYANLSNANLTGANLSQADLMKASLEQADLTNANLTDTYLNRANLTDADLSNANLTGANLRANLYNANLTGADLTNATLLDTSLRELNLTGANLSGLDLRAVSYYGDYTTNWTDTYYYTDNEPLWEHGMIQTYFWYADPDGTRRILAIDPASGDINSDGVFDAADYTLWQDNGGDHIDYRTWKYHFGQSSASGSGADHVPEPTTLLLALLALVAVPLRVRHG